jgi:group I intron endonuclease
MNTQFIIYLTTNLITGKKYIGLHSKNNPNYFGSGTLLLKAIKKYGKNNFKKEILAESDDIIEANKLERYFIDIYDAVNSNDFYNLSYGGENIAGRTHSLETCYKISNGLKNTYKNNDELRYRVGTANRGKKSSDIKKYKISKSNTGKYRTDECKRNLSEIAKERYNNDGMKYPSLINIETGKIIQPGINVRRLAKELNINHSNLRNVIIGKRKSCSKWQIL